MDPEEFLESEVAVAAAAVAVLFSPRVRGLVRRGLTLGLTTLFAAGGALPTAIGHIARDIGHMSGTPVDGLQDITAESKTGPERAG
ncbi:MAG: hypothetical protein JOZ41_16380 [Chloroflexi bacterium]|nr:hypothetical protein [Chloroflexota bacterium]